MKTVKKKKGNQFFNIPNRILVFRPSIGGNILINKQFAIHPPEWMKSDNLFSTFECK